MSTPIMMNNCVPNGDRKKMHFGEMSTYPNTNEIILNE